MSKIRVAVIFGGISSEHEISLSSAAYIIKNIPKDSYEVIPIGVTKKGRWLYYPGGTEGIVSGEWASCPDCTPAILSPDPMHKGIIKLEGDDISYTRLDAVFPLIHGRGGEDGSLQGLLELSGIPYVGCGLSSSVICNDKALTHALLSTGGIKTAKWHVVRQVDLGILDEKCSDIINDLKLPVFVKPARCGSSMGVTKVYEQENLKDAVKLAFSHDSKVIVEEYIEGRELAVAIFGHDFLTASSVGEILPCNEFYDFDAKYVLSSSQLVVPADIDSKTADEIRSIAIKAYRLASCSGLVCCDFFLSEKHGIVLSEMDCLPDYLPGSIYSKITEDMGFAASELIDRLIISAMDNANSSR